jgi:hypothetical protein
MNIVDRVALALAERAKLTQHLDEKAAIARYRPFARALVVMVGDDLIGITDAKVDLEMEIQVRNSGAATLVPSHQLSRIKQERDAFKKALFQINAGLAMGYRMGGSEKIHDAMDSIALLLNRSA